MQTSSIFRPRDWLSVVAFVVLLCNLVTCSKLSENPEKSVRFCGDRLVNAVLELCNNRIHDPRVKRDVEVQNDAGRPGVLGSPNPQRARFPQLVQREEAAEILRRSRRGIVHECCRNRCTINEMMLYCALDR